LVHDEAKAALTGHHTDAGGNGVYGDRQMSRNAPDPHLGGFAPGGEQPAQNPLFSAAEEASEPHQLACAQGYAIGALRFLEDRLSR
jgi:hypothetical protein